LNATRRLATRLHDWTALEDYLALWVFGFFAKFPDLGIIYQIHEDDIAQLVQMDYADSDLAGSEDSAKSTSGWLVAITTNRPSASASLDNTPGSSTDLLPPRPRSFAMIDHGVRRQTVTAFSSPDAELRAQADMIVRSAATLNVIMKALFLKVVEEIVNTDNAAAAAAMRAGHSRRMAYMRRTQKISAGLCADYVAEDNTKLQLIRSGENLSDLYTKAMDSNLFWRLCRAQGISRD
jgi:hypothetical protein